MTNWSKGKQQFLAFVFLELLLVFPEAGCVLTVEKRDFTVKNVSMYVSIFLACKLSAGLWGLSTEDWKWTQSLLAGYLLLRSNSLHRRRNLIPVSNVCESAPRSLFWSPNGLNELQKMRFKFPFNLIGKSGDDGFFNEPIMVLTQILVHR